MTRVLIVGAGPCGLVALKEMLAAGLQATAVDMAPSFGGVFRESNGATYSELYLTTSNYFMAFSDFPPLENAVRYSSLAQYQTYLSAYVEHFDLLRHIEFGTKVVRASFDEASGCWSVEVASEAGTRTLSAEYLIVATGLHGTPFVPEFGGYTGEVLHSSEYRGAADFVDKRVLVAGVGESAADIACEICEVATDTVAWSRRPFLVAPRFPLAALEDKNYDEHQIIAERSASKNNINDFLEFFTISRMSNSLSVVTYTMIRLLVFSIFRLAPFASSTAKRLERWTALATADNFWMQDQAMVVTKNARLACSAAAGDISVIVAKDIRCAGRRVEFVDVLMNDSPEGEGTTREFDAIVACTGFQTKLSWLDVDVSLNPRDWYKHAFAPQFDGKLVFLGWARPQQGGLPVCAEMLARYAARIAAGELRLPADVDDQIAAEKKAEQSYFRGTPHINSLVDYLSLMEAAAELVGCRPRMPNPIRSPRRFAQYWLYPQWSCWYRKDGVGSKPEVLESVLSKIEFSLLHAFPLLLVHAALLVGSAPMYLIDRLVTRFQGPKRRRQLRKGWMWRQSKVSLLHGARNRRSHA